MNPMKARPDVTFMDPNYPADWGIHTGVDLNHPDGGDSDLGQPIHAITDGRVEAVLKNIGPSWGNIVVLWHPGPGVWTRYAHLEKVLVQRCQVVSAGQVIGTVGKGFGNRWQAHLHLDVLKKRPERWDDWPGQDRARLLEHYLDPWAFLQKQAQAGRISKPQYWIGRYANIA
ncbi:M23 family metallopeptidase [Meiothermus sp.]|uniref:M23 family metallopeptidase n=1 Tax=Meiothermus sp. TaxID=1955249 RepID=UPI0021DF10A3|nr:M23 family metallopeptidase [Meiothermus sp.]GIW32857.1 MAG: hypothetical protein KatS3mg072_0190 [Meiothermus sp.]